MPKRTKPQAAAVIEKRLYTMAVTGKHADINMYGEIVETRPVDWWTGEPIGGDFIMLDEFLRDLDTLAEMDSITIHMNSIGGDAFASIAIYNRLKALKAEKTVIVDGVAMSGGSLIMCAADTVQANPSSLIMVHQCWTYYYDRVNADALTAAAEKLAAIDRSQAEIYMTKTGKTMDEVLEIMRGEKYMTGREAMELGFVDELVDEDINPDISVSADHRTMFVRGHSMRVAAMGQLPEGIVVVESEGEQSDGPTEDGIPTGAEAGSKEAEGANGGDIEPPVASGENEGGHSNMTWEEFLAQNPEAANQALANAKAEAVAAERQRMAEIDEVATLFDAEMVNAAKYGDNTCTAAELAYRVAQANAKQGKAFMNAAVADAKESGANEVTPAPAPEETPAVKSPEELVKAGLAAAKAAMEVK